MTSRIRLTEILHRLLPRKLALSCRKPSCAGHPLWSAVTLWLAHVAPAQGLSRKCAALFDIARREGRNVHEIATLVDQARPRNSSLTAAIRVFVMAYYRAAATEEGHARAGHGYGRILYPDHNVNAASARLPRQFRQTS